MDSASDVDGLSLTELARRADVTPRTVRYYIAQGLIPAPPAGPGQHYGTGSCSGSRSSSVSSGSTCPWPRSDPGSALSTTPRWPSALAEAETGDDEIFAARALDVATSPDRARALSYIRRVLDEGATRRAGSLRKVMAPLPAHRSLIGPSAAAGSLPPPAPAPPAPASMPPPPASTSMPPLASKAHLADGAASVSESQLRREPRMAPSARYEPHVPDEYPMPDDAHAPSGRPLPAMPFPAVGPRPMPGERSTWERLPLAADLELHVRRPLDRETNRRLDRLLAFARELFEGT